MDTQQFAQFMQQHVEDLTRLFFYIVLFLILIFLVIYGFLRLIARHLNLTSTSSVLSQYHARGNTTQEGQLYLAFWENGFNLNHNNTNNVKKHITNTLRVYERIGLLVRKGGVNRHWVPT